MGAKRTWLWVVLFIWLAGLIAVLATGWNVVIFQDHERITKLTGSLDSALSEGPWLRIALGTLGFVAALGTIVLFFVRLLREMNLTQVQSDFIARVSHELRTPIASMELAATLLKREGLTAEERARLWESHQAELRRLRSEVELLLEATRAASGRKEKAPPQTRETIELETWLRESLPRWERMLGEGAPAAALTESPLIRREGPPLGIQVQADRRTLDLIADNLVDNARKYAKGPARLTIRTESQTHRAAPWRIDFADEGWGFPPEEKKRIFQRFYRAKTTAPYAVGGTGLGLYLAVEAAKDLGIHLSARSAGHGRGATFTIEGRR